MEQQMQDLVQRVTAMQAEIEQQRAQSAQTAERNRALENEVARRSRENLEISGQRGAVGAIEIGQLLQGMTHAAHGRNEKCRTAWRAELTPRGCKRLRETW